NLTRANFVFQLLVGLVNTDCRAGTRGETAIRVEHDALRVDMFGYTANPCGDLFGGVDDARGDSDTSKADFEILPKVLEHLTVARFGGGELHGQVVELQSIQVIDNGTISPRMTFLSSDSRSSPTAQVQSEPASRHSLDDRIDHL